MTDPSSTREARFSDALVGGFQNIRVGSAFVVSIGWTIFLIYVAIKVAALADDPIFISADKRQGQVRLVSFGAFAALVYTMLSLVVGWRKPSSTVSTFIITVLFAPMAITSFALGIGHAFDSQIGDILSVGSGVMNLSVIVMSWLISTNFVTKAATS